MTKKAYVENASNKDQIREASRKERAQRKLELEDLKAVLETDAGKRLVWRILKHCKVFESIWHPSAMIHKNAGAQDVGHFLMAEIVAANETALMEMMAESKKGAM